MIVNSIHNQSIELLLEAKANLSEMLARMKEKNGKSKAYNDISRTVDTISYTINYIKDLEIMVDKIDQLRYHNQILEKHNRFLLHELRPYQEIKRQIVAGTLDQNIAIVKALIDIDRM